MFIKPYQCRGGSKESASCWTMLVETLTNNYKDEQFDVTAKSLRNHFNLLINKRNRKVNEEERASGIEVHEKEIDILMDNIISEMKDCAQKLKEEVEESHSLEDLEKKKAEGMRKKAMETFEETRKRKCESEEDEISMSQKRRTGAETKTQNRGRDDDLFSRTSGNPEKRTRRGNGHSKA